MRATVAAAITTIFGCAGLANAQTTAPGVQPDMSNMSGDAADRFLERQTNYGRLSENVSSKSRALRAVPALPRDVVQGLEVRDAAGLVIGTVAKVSDGYAVVASSLGSVEVDVTSLAKNKLGLLINLPKHKIDAMMKTAIRRPDIAAPQKKGIVEGAIHQPAGVAPRPDRRDRPPSELVVGADGLVRVSINGRAAILRIDPAAPSLPLITRKLATSAGFKMKGRTAGATGYLVGRTQVPVRSQMAKVDLGYGTVRRRVGWTDPPFASVADGSIGPGAMSQTLVRFQLREPIAGEQTVALVMEPDSLWSGALNEFSAVFAIIEVGGKPVRVGFDPHHARTLVTAGAGLRLARQNKGVISGDAVPTEIYFGVRRPVRTLTLQRPFQLGTLAIRTLGIRTSDAGHVAGIEETDTPDSPSDPVDVVVTGKVRKRNVRSDTISLGADYLSRCSSIIFDRNTRSIQLTCA